MAPLARRKSFLAPIWGMSSVLFSRIKRRDSSDAPFTALRSVSDDVLSTAGTAPQQLASEECRPPLARSRSLVSIVWHNNIHIPGRQNGGRSSHWDSVESLVSLETIKGTVVEDQDDDDDTSTLSGISSSSNDPINASGNPLQPRQAIHFTPLELPESQLWPGSFSRSVLGHFGLLTSVVDGEPDSEPDVSIAYTESIDESLTSFESTSTSDMWKASEMHGAVGDVDEWDESEASVSAFRKPDLGSRMRHSADAAAKRLSKVNLATAALVQGDGESRGGRLAYTGSEEDRLKGKNADQDLSRVTEESFF